MSLPNIQPPIQGKLVTFKEALRQIPGPQGQHFAQLFKHGSFSLEIYAPRQTDPQKPHTQDEGYIVMQGREIFVFGDQRLPFALGDFLFAPAGVVHRFENFSDDLVLWVIFYGTEGGEKE